MNRTVSRSLAPTGLGLKLLACCIVLTLGVSIVVAADKAQESAKPQAKEKAKTEAKPEAKPKKEAPKEEAPKKESSKKEEPKSDEVSFRRDVAPILVQNCLACHGQTDPKGQYQLHTFKALSRAGSSSLTPFTGGDLDESEIYRLIASDDPNERMPKDADPLPADQQEIIRRWIEQGAKFDGTDPEATLASLVPRRQHPQPPKSYRTPLAVTALAFSPDGNELAVGGYHEITIWSVEGKLLRRIPDVEQRVYSLAYSPDGKLLASAGGTPGQSGEFALYSPKTGKLVRSLGTTSDTAFAVCFDPEGKRVAGSSADRSIRIFDAAKGTELRVIEDHADWVMGLAFSPDGKLLASAARDKTSKVFDLETGEAVVTYPGHNETVLGVAFSPDGKQVYSAGADRRIHLWNLADGKQAATITGYGGEVYSLLIADDQVFSCAGDKLARLHTLSDRKEVRKFTGHADYVYTLTYHPGTKRLATGSFDGEVRVWNVEDGKSLANFVAAPGFEPTQTAQTAK